MRHIVIKSQRVVGTGISMGICSPAGCSLAGGTAFARGFCSALFHAAFCNKIRLLVLATRLLLPKGPQGH